MYGLNIQFQNQIRVKLSMEESKYSARGWIESERSISQTKRTSLPGPMVMVPSRMKVPSKGRKRTGSSMRRENAEAENTT